MGVTAPDFLAGGEMATVVRATDWSKTPLGPMESWSPSLRTAVDLYLSSKDAGREQSRPVERAQNRLRFTLDAAQMGEAIFDARRSTVVHTPGFAVLFGYPGDRKLTTEEIRAGYHPDDREALLARSAAALAGSEDYFEIEYRVVWPDETMRWLAGRVQVARDADGAATDVTAVYMDVTARKEAEDRQRLLLDELNHRVKNTLATVQSIAKQTRRNTESPETFGEAFEARITALANAHDLLTRSSWEGASLADVLQLTLAPYAAQATGDAPRIAVAGPSIKLGPNAAVTLNMAFHELATNASKYGALSTSHGRLAVRWSVDRSVEPALVEILWREEGGPPVAPPRRRGFGSRLVEEGLARQLDGEVKLSYEPTGVSCSIRLPASQRVHPG